MDVFLFFLRCYSIAVLVGSVSLIDYPLDIESVRLLWYYQLGHIAILSRKCPCTA